MLENTYEKIVTLIQSSRILSPDEVNINFNAFLQRHNRILGLLQNKEPVGVSALIDTVSKLASPSIGLDDQNRLHAKPNTVYDAPIIDEELVSLPQIQVAAADMLRKHIPKNAPLIVKDSLREYRSHLEQRGAQPILGILIQFANAVLAEYKGAEGCMWGDGLASLFDSFESNHQKLLKYFPMNIEREELIASTPIDEDAFLEPEVREAFDAVFEVLPELVDKDLVSPDFLASMEGIKKQLNYVETVPPASDPSGLKISPQRRFVVWTTGIFIQIREKIAGIVEYGNFFNTVYALAEALLKLFI